MFVLRHRVFNLFVFFLSIAGFFDLLMSLLYYRYLPQIVISIFLSATLIYLYYLVRIKSLFSAFIIVSSAIFLLLILSISFFYNSGTHGKVIPVLFIYLMIYLLSTRKPLNYYVAGLHMVSIISILLLQYLHPEWVTNYSNDTALLLDNVATFIYFSFVMYYVVDIIKNDLQKEQESYGQKDNYLDKQKLFIRDLLSELNHRVKNNLQVISALLSLQAYRTKHPQAVSALQEGKNRLESMSIVHKKLYQEEFFNQISLAEYIDDLIDHVLTGLDNPLEIEKKVEDIMLTADQAIPLGLILNEIFTDIKTHAMADQSESRKVEIRSHVNHTLLLIFVTNNVKTGKRKAGLKKKSKISKELIEMLIKQLDGTWEISDSPSEGEEIRITFTLRY